MKREKSMGIFLVMLLMLVPCCVAPAEAIAVQRFEYFTIPVYNQTTYNSQGYGNVLFGNNVIAQTFKIGVNGKNQTHHLYNIRILVTHDAQDGLTIGTCYVKVYDVDENNLPTGEPLGVGTFNGDATATQGNWGWVTVYMQRPLLHRGTRYIFTIQAPNAPGMEANLRVWRCYGSYGLESCRYYSEFYQTWTDLIGVYAFEEIGW